MLIIKKKAFYWETKIEGRWIEDRFFFFNYLRYKITTNLDYFYLPISWNYLVYIPLRDLYWTRNKFDHIHYSLLPLSFFD